MHQNHQTNMQRLCGTTTFLSNYCDHTERLRPRKQPNKLKKNSIQKIARSKVTVSEMAETCSENIEEARQVLPRWSPDYIISMMMKDKDAVYLLNTENDAPVTPEVVSKMMQFHCTNQINAVKFFEHMERLGNILFPIGTHFRSLRTLIINSKDYAQLIQMIRGEDKEFKSKPNASVLQVATAQ